MSSQYIKAVQIPLKNHPQFDERWVQNLIEDDPSILGLGKLEFRDKERIQPHAGRLDLLLQDPKGSRRYEVELHLGPTDPSHIIRAIEYWDIEKKRYPQYDHCAVLIAEDITSRFLNVISLLNGSIPIIAISMQAFQVGDSITLTFVKIVHELSLGFVDEDEQPSQTDRAYWVANATQETVELAEKLLTKFQVVDSTLNLNFTKYYIGLNQGNRPYNFLLFRPKKKFIGVEFFIGQSSSIDEKIEQAGLDFSYKIRQYQLNLTPGDVDAHSELLVSLAQDAYQQRNS